MLYPPLFFYTETSWYCCTMKNDFSFPKDFTWGAATSAYQVEGGIENCDWAQAAREGKVPACGRACDHYNRYEQDFDIAQSLGHNAHRFSIEWSRIEPEEGKFDEKEIEHYRNVLLALRERGLEPSVTLWHWTLPCWLQEKGGIEHAEFPEIFARYCTYVVSHLSDLATHFTTLNEPYSTVINGWVRGTFPPFHRFPLISLVPIPSDKELSKHATLDWGGIIKFFTLANVLAQAHNTAYVSIKKVVPQVHVTVVFQVHYFNAHGNPWYKLLAKFQMWNMTHRYLKRIYKNSDSIGLNYYFYTDFGNKTNYPKTDMGWDFRPEGIYDAIMEVRRYNKPIYVEECGCADAKDAFREEYIRKTVEGIERAIKDGADVRGFMYWSLLDNYEWAHGFEKRFGLVEINYDTLERTIRPSAYVYRDIINTHKK
jgi:beta-glucosidase